MRTKKHLLLLSLVFIAFLAVIWLYFNVSKKALVLSDEADYIWTGNRIGLAIREKNLPLFNQLSWGQFRYPFFQSWYLSLATLPFEYTIYLSRLVSLLLLIPSVILIFLLGKKLDKGNFTSFLASVVFLVSPAVLFYFSIAMKEGLATLLSLTVIIFYFLGREKKNFTFFLASGFCLLCLMLTKYNYGGLICLAFVIEGLIWLTLERGFKDRFYWLANIFWVLPLVVGMYYWVFVPISRFSYLWPFPQADDVFNLGQTTLLGHLLYYPLELAFSYSFSWPVFLALSFGFVYSFKRWRNYKIRVLTFFFLINFFLAEKHIINNQARYIFTSVPAFFLLGSFGISNLIVRLKKFKPKIMSLGLIFPALIIVTAIMVKDLIILPKMILATASHIMQTAMLYEQDYHDISSYNFSRKDWPHVKAKPQTEKVEDLIMYAFEQMDLSRNINYVGCSNELSSGLFSFYLDKEKEKGVVGKKTDGIFEYYLVIQTEKGGRFDTLDYQLICSKRIYWVEEVLKNSSLLLVSKKHSEDLGLTITILGSKW